MTQSQKHQPDDALIQTIRDRFAHVDSCPFEGPRVFFENAGGALTLKSVVEPSPTIRGAAMAHRRRWCG